MINSYNPKISIVIIAKNEEDYIENTINELINKSCYENFEILVINDGSTDNTESIIKSIISKKTNYNIRIITTNGIGIPKSRNLGEKNTDGEILVFGDAHLLISERWAKNLVEFYINEDFDFGTFSIYAFTKKWVKVVKTYGNNLDSKFDLECLLTNKFNGYSPIAVSSFQVFKRKSFLDIGNYDEEYLYYGHEDIEISIRAWLFGYKIKVIPNINIGHLWREENRYNLNSLNYNYNILRTAFLHMDKDNINKIIGIINFKNKYSGNPDKDFKNKLLDKLEKSNINKIKSIYTNKLKFDFNWYKEIFNVEFVDLPRFYL